MPKYFFSIIDGVYIPDNVGIDLPSDEAAKIAAGEIKDDLDAVHDHGEPLSIKITREDGSKVD